MQPFNQSHYWHSATGLPQGVYAGQTLAIIDHQQPLIQPYLQQNLALHVGDNPQTVQQHRMQLLAQLRPYGAKRLHWLNQTHSTTAYTVEDILTVRVDDGDGLITRESGVALMMMTADCLPIVISNADGSEVACLHAGWRGLAHGIIENTVNTMQTAADAAWIGTGICQSNFEVGEEVKQQFCQTDTAFAQYFQAQKTGKFMADLYAIARHKMQQLGIRQVSGGDHCSYGEEQFYSYRRQAITGRMATFIFITEKNGKIA